ncbi:putative gamma-tubulin complex component protein [Plasmopara halstedii]
MAPVPAWTREWRPLARQLCAHIITDDATNEAEQSLFHRETLFLRADRVVGQLYSHRFVDSVPQDVQAQTQALAQKFRVHSLEDRAEKLLELSIKCDYQVLKLLLELAKSPTTATDQEVAVDLNTESKWKTIIQKQQHELEKHKLLQEQLVEELFQISTNDEWFQEWEDSDEESSDWDIGSLDENAAKTNCDVESSHRKLMSSNETLNNELDKNQKQTDSVLECDFEQTAPQEINTSELLELSDDEVIQNDLIRRYYQKITPTGDDMEADVEDPTILLDKESLTPFTLKRPWLLCEAVVKSAEATTAIKDIVSSRLIHESTVVNMVFEALHGIESLLFDFYPVNPMPSVFSTDFRTKYVRRTQHSQNVAMGHISPLTFHNVIDHFAEAASELQMLRDFIHFVHGRCDLNEQLRCVTFEGLADALSEILKRIVDSIIYVEQQANTLGMKDSRPWTGIHSRQPTLIGLLGGLKKIFAMVSWLNGILKECFHALSHQKWHEIKRAQQAKCVLDSLYRLMELEFVEGMGIDEVVRPAQYLSRSNVLLHLFIGALMPYLGLLNRMVFNRGFFETIPLESELFFVRFVSINRCDPSWRERNQNFRERLMLLAPFEIKGSLMPAFLESMSSLFIEALASRQLQNQFLQQQHTSNESLTNLKLTGPSLQDMFLSELEKRGCKRICGIFSVVSTKVRSPEGDMLSLPQTMLDCVPFSNILKQCLTQHIEHKCHELNGEITDIFRDKMNYMEHVETLRLCVLMEQQDVLGSFCDKLFDHMQRNPVALADIEKINAFYQGVLQGVFENNSLSSTQRTIGGHLYLRVNLNQVESIFSSGTNIDIATMKCLYFTFALSDPLRVLFSASIMQKYSQLGILLLQVKSVESALIKFKSTIRHHRSYFIIENELRQALLQIADMLHYTKTLLNYLLSQISSERWSKCRDELQASQSLAEMDAIHEKYLDHLLNRFFLLEKHATVVQYIVTTFNNILCFVGHVEKFAGAVDRNLHQYFPSMSFETNRDKVSSVPLLEHPDFCILRSEMTQSAKNYKRQSHFLVVMLTAMQKHGASKHVEFILTHLNFNYFYHHKDDRSRIQRKAQDQHKATNANF